MQRATVYCCSMLLLNVLASAQNPPLSIQAGGRLFPGPDIDALLARPYQPHVPMACAGQRVWAAHPEGWAFASSVYYYEVKPGILGFDLKLRAGDRPLLCGDATMFPSHVTGQASMDRLVAEGWKWITHDDVLAARIRLRNGGDSPVSAAATLTLPVAAVEERDRGEFAWTGNVADLTVHILGAARGFQPEHHTIEDARVYWSEGEATVSPSGNNGLDKMAGAHGGGVLGGTFGAAPGDTAEWIIHVDETMDAAALAIRYARLNPKEAAYRVEVNGVEVAGRAAFTPTSGWGERETHFQIAQWPIGTIAAGNHRVRIAALAKDAKVNIDLIAILPRDELLTLPIPLKHVRAQTIVVPAHGEQYIDVYLAAATRPEEAERALARVLEIEDPLRDQVETYQAWLVDNLPAFTSEDAALEKMYWHRVTSVIRKNLFRLGEGRLSRWSMAEGRWNSERSANVISYGAGHHIRETRWLRDPVYVRDIIATWCENARENGLFPSHIPATGAVTGQHADWIPAAVWDAYRVQPEIDALRRWVPALERNIDGWLAEYDKDNDGLLLADSHRWTGMEWQPSFFFFNGSDRTREGQRLERVDLTACVYGGAKHVAEMLAELGDSAGSARFAETAARLHDAILKHMWDDASQYFFPVEPETHQKALVKEIAGVYPFYFAMLDPALEAGYAVTWRSLVDPAQLWTTWPAASASRQCPAYSQDERFNGRTVGGRMWNGPTWPHANSLVLSAMAETLREYPKGPLSVPQFHALLVSYTNAQFLHQNLEFPWTGEFYSGDTGEWRTDERDCNHSTYLDVLIADLAGLRPRADGILEIRPLIEDHTPGFMLDGIRYHGHDLTIAWTRAAGPGPGPDGRKGFRIYADGRLLYTGGERSAPRRILRDISAGFTAVPAEQGNLP